MESAACDWPDPWASTTGKEFAAELAGHRRGFSPIRAGVRQDSATNGARRARGPTRRWPRSGAVRPGPGPRAQAITRLRGRFTEPWSRRSGCASFAESPPARAQHQGQRTAQSAHAHGATAIAASDAPHSRLDGLLRVLEAVVRAHRLSGHADDGRPQALTQLARLTGMTPGWRTRSPRQPLLLDEADRSADASSRPLRRTSWTPSGMPCWRRSTSKTRDAADGTAAPVCPRPTCCGSPPPTSTGVVPLMKGVDYLTRLPRCVGAGAALAFQHWRSVTASRGLADGRPAYWCSDTASSAASSLATDPTGPGLRPRQRARLGGDIRPKPISHDSSTIASASASST